MLLWIRDLMKKNPDVPWPSVMTVCAIHEKDMAEMDNR